jgi:uncharacterized membrane protein YeiB
MDDNLQEVLTSPTLNRLWLFAYLIPVFGMVPAVWTLTQGKSDRRYRAMSRLTLSLGGAWLLGSVVFNSALSASESGMSTQMSLMLINSVFTSGYFVLSLALMVRLWKRKPSDLPSFSESLKLFTKPLR